MTTDRAVLLRAAAALAQTWGNAAGDPSASLVEVMDEAADELDQLCAENERLREALGRYPGTPEGLDDLRCDLHSTIHGWEQTSCDDSAHEDYVDDLVTSIIELLGSAAASLSETGGEDEREWHCEAVAVGLVSDAGECSPEQQIHNAPCGWRP